MPMSTPLIERLVKDAFGSNRKVLMVGITLANVVAASLMS